ncbi:ankyrin repeat domain-containing protein [Myxococcus stipitatus]|uniref:ankyrin repeat domain-containing protein n=1 Tax=Myxococcus stipitatus TaxID=83455 RepID=UPI003145567A
MSLFDAVLAADRASLESQLDSGADPNPFDAEGQTPLMVAAREGHDELLGLLLDAGADPSLTNAIGESAIILAAAHGHEECVRLLAGSATDEEAAMVRALMDANASGSRSTPPAPPPDDLRHKLASAAAYVAGKLGDDGPAKRLERLLRASKPRKP